MNYFPTLILFVFHASNATFMAWKDLCDISKLVTLGLASFLGMRSFSKPTSLRTTNPK